MRVAIRRTLRVGRRSGDPVEGFGVEPDFRHFMTRNDLMNSNADLIDRAGELLAGLPVRELSVSISSSDGSEIILDVTTRGMSRIDVYADGRPIGSVDVGDGQTELTVPGDAGTLRLEGFEGGDLVAARRIDVS